MNQIVLIKGLSVLLFGICCPSSDQDGKLARLRETFVARQAEQASREQAHEAHLAQLTEEIRRTNRRMEELAKDMDARFKSYKTKVVRPEEERRRPQVAKTSRESRAAVDATPAARK